MITGRVVSVNVGSPRNVAWNRTTVSTAIFKEPVVGRVLVRRLGLEGDSQADLSVHGGVDQAVYAYPAEHYDYWGAEVGKVPLPWGTFGENLTTQGIMESVARLGDEFRVGSVMLVVAQPRFPGYKLGVKFGTMEMVRRFQASGRSGFYLSVLEEGEVGAGDMIELINRDSSHPTIHTIFTSTLVDD